MFISVKTKDAKRNREDFHVQQSQYWTLIFLLHHYGPITLFVIPFADTRTSGCFPHLSILSMFFFLRSIPVVTGRNSWDGKGHLVQPPPCLEFSLSALLNLIMPCWGWGEERKVSSSCWGLGFMAGKGCSTEGEGFQSWKALSKWKLRLPHCLWLSALFLPWDF